MESIYIPQPRLGWVAEAVNTAGNITSSIIQAKTQSKANDAAMKQALLQIDGQKALSQQETERLDKMLKLATIGGAVLVIGVIALVVFRKK